VAELTASDGVRLHYDESGDPSGRPIVLIAGFRAAARSWRFQVRAFGRAGYRVIAFDRRGHGASEVATTGHDMPRHGADIHDLLETLDLRDVTLVGQSMGGNAIWAMVEQFGTGRVRDIVIVDQTPKMLNDDGWAHGFYDYDASNADTLFAEGIPDPGRHSAGSKGLARIARVVVAMDLLRGGRGEPAFTDAELALLHDHATRDWRAVIADVDVPVLFVAGRESEFWPSEHAAASAALNPLATSAVIERDGHATNIEQPAAFNRGVLEWLER